jgi:hypothetical protein
MPAKINYRALQLAIDRPLERACRQAAIELANERFEEAKETLLERFLSDPISQEIEEGAKTEGGILPVVGNLFSFIGFEDGTQPIQDLYNFLNDNITLQKNPTYDRVKKQYLFNVYQPSKEEIKAETPMPWGTARSWVFAIESGISGLNQYLSSQRQLELRQASYAKRKFHKAGTEPPEEKDLGRSTGGIQVKGIISQGGFTPHKYLSDMLNNFIRNVKGVSD